MRLTALKRILTHALKRALGRIALACLAWLPLSPARAECAPPAMPPDAAAVRQGMQQARDHGYLWQIERDGRRSWLYGTVHVAQQAWMYPGPTVLSALSRARSLVVEVDMSDPATLAALPQLARQTPDMALPPALEARLQQQEDAACLGGALRGWRPEMRVTTLSVMALRDEGLDPAWGVDAFLTGLARGLNLPVLALETPAQQMAIILQPDAAAAAEMVRVTLDELDSGRARSTLRRLAGAWADGRLDELERYPQWCQCLDTPFDQALMRRLLDERNGPMADGIERLHRSAGSVFVAVGSLHMVGPQGLPALLAARGFRVQPVSWPTAHPRAAEHSPAPSSDAESTLPAAVSGLAQENSR